MRYQLQEPVFHTLEVKKSKFITWLVPANSKQDVDEWLKKARHEYPDARHYCYAYKFLLNGTPHASMNDDGEPSGTAGKPILNVLTHKPDCNALVIVIRYFGGIKLGAGGLVRAYSQATEMAFQQANLIAIQPRIRLNLTFSFAKEQWLRHQVSVLSGEVLDVTYSENVSASVEINVEDLEQFEEVLAAESVKFEVIE